MYNAIIYVCQIGHLLLSLFTMSEIEGASPLPSRLFYNNYCFECTCDALVYCHDCLDCLDSCGAPLDFLVDHHHHTKDCLDYACESCPVDWECSSPCCSLVACYQLDSSVFLLHVIHLTHAVHAIH
eukprot:792305_1